MDSSDQRGARVVDDTPCWGLRQSFKGEVHLAGTMRNGEALQMQYGKEDWERKEGPSLTHGWKFRIETVIVSLSVCLCL